MDTCLDGLIKVGRECEGTGNITLEEIGLLLPEIDSFVDGNYKNGRELGEAKIHSAIHQVFQDIHARFNEKYRLNTVIDNEKLGYFNGGCATVENRGSYSGIELEFCSKDSYIDIYVSDVELNLRYSGKSKLYVYNLLTGKKLDEFEFESIEGCATFVEINKTYKAVRQRLHLGFLIDSSEIEFSYETFLKNSGCKSCEKGNMARANKFIHARGVYVKPEIDDSDIDPETGEFLQNAKKIKTNIFGERHTSGMTIHYSCQCNHDDWICQYKNKLIFPILYKAGEEILKYALYTSNCLNSKTTLDAEKLQLRVIEYKENYERLIKPLIDGIKVPFDNTCFHCRDSVTYRTKRP